MGYVRPFGSGEQGQQTLPSAGTSPFLHHLHPQAFLLVIECVKISGAFQSTQIHIQINGYKGGEEGDGDVNL